MFELADRVTEGAVQTHQLATVDRTRPVNATRPGWLSHQMVSACVHSPIRPKSEICWQASTHEQ